jgi:hypothetical protein
MFGDNTLALEIDEGSIRVPLFFKVQSRILLDKKVAKMCESMP